MEFCPYCGAGVACDTKLPTSVWLDIRVSPMRAVTYLAFLICYSLVCKATLFNK
jgi:hypothetical protein